MLTAVTITTLAVIFVAWKMCVVVPMREAYVKERLGKFAGVLPPGLHFLIPFVDSVAYQQEMREQVLDIPAQSCITRDNIQVEVDGLVYLKVMDAEQASYGIQDYRRACVNLAQTTMRAEIGKLTLDNTFSEREAVNEGIVREIDKASGAWGVKVMRYEIRNINPSNHVIETLEKQMEAERHKRANILLATAEKEGVINLSQGEKQEAVNLSEGSRQQRINESNGRAKEITLLAQATAHGIERIGRAIGRPGGDTALKMRIIEQFIDELGLILQQSKVSVVPAELANIKGFFEGMSRVGTGIANPQPAAAAAPRAKPAPAPSKTL